MGACLQRIQEIPELDRPRERMMAKGPSALADTELLALIIGTGRRNQSALDLASSILRCLDEEGLEPRLDQLQKVHGIGPVNAMKLAASLEFARRRIKPAGLRIRNPEDFYGLIRHYGDRKQEHFICASLNGADEVIAIRVVTVGLVDRAHVHPREVFAEPIKDRASGIMVAHNHPSGNTRPGREDIEVTRRLVQAGYTLGIELLDHLVFSHSGFYSFDKEKALPMPKLTP